MEAILLLAFSIVVAILFNFGAPKFAATKIGQKFVGNYAWTTLGTALVIFGAVYIASLLLSAAGERPTLPAV